MYYYAFASGNSSLFTERKYAEKLKEIGLIRKNNPLFCKMIVCRNIDKAKIAARFFPFKKIVVYQPELFVDTVKTKAVKVNWFNRVIVINGFNEGVFFNNFHFLSSYIYNDENDLGLKKNELLSTSSLFTEEQFKRARHTIFVGMKRKATEIEPKNSAMGIDLNTKRQEIAQATIDKGIGVVVGKGWGKQAKYEGSGFDAGNTNWWDTKLELLKSYRFNIALENTLWKYYVTEKIWHAIKAGCLPIYWGKGSSIYDTFPKNSFIDASEFETSEALVDYIADLSYDSWFKRMEKCIETYNASIQKMTYSKLDEALNRIQERIFGSLVY